MNDSSPEIDVIKDIKDTLEHAKVRLGVAEQVAATVPGLRREIKVLEKAYNSLTAAPTQRRKVGPTIKDAIFEALNEAGGTLTFPPGGMLSTVHALTGGNPNSVQVEIHRLRESGKLIADKNAAGKPIALRVARQKLKALPGGASQVG